MNRPRRSLWRGAALVAGLLMAVCGCSGTPSPTPTPTLGPVSPRALAALVEQHFGVGRGAFAAPADYESAMGGVVVYSAEPGVPTRSVRLGWAAETGPSWTRDDDSCRSTLQGQSPYRCVVRDGVRIGWKRGSDEAWAVSPRGSGLMVAHFDHGTLPADPLKDDVTEDVQALIALAKDPRADALTATDPLTATTPWTDDPTCSQSAPVPTSTPPGAGGEPAEAATPQAFVALIAERVSGTCGFGASHAGDPRVSGTLYLGAGDDEKVTVAVTSDKVGCNGMDACETRGNLTIAWQFDVPEEYPATVQVSRAIAGGQLVVTHTSRRANAKTRAFPVPLETLITLASSDRFGFTVDPALNRAGAASPLCWKLLAPTGA